MRRAFAHNAVLRIEDGGDDRAPGAAITVALCGHWDHEPPCPLAPHLTVVERTGDEVRLRVLFAAEPDAETEVRGRIAAALALPSFLGLDGVLTRWHLLRGEPSDVTETESEHTERLLHGN
ncbi:MAG: hypothetical protein HOV68_12995 [Streptomycetaceae bacterium]|nr:hypothetical protein [Streptomycetaceae bacterium]